MTDDITTDFGPAPLKKLGRYEITGELGRGGMGVVFSGFDPAIGRSVAIKTVLVHGDAMLLKRLQREARAVGRLNHPNIVTIHDVGEDGGVFYIAMEFVEGETLERRLSKGPLPLDVIVPIAEQVGAALDYAHTHKDGSVVHRDIKPPNIMISPHGIKVMDFGLAKLYSSSATGPTNVIGTPYYMSPEVWGSAPLDGRADIFSLGVTIYEALTGRKPFTGDRLPTVMRKILEEAPLAPSEIVPSLGRELDAVLLKALAKNRNLRYQKCSHFSADLRNRITIPNAPAPAASIAPQQVTASKPELLVPVQQEPEPEQGVWTDSATGLMWTKQDSGFSMSWNEAVSHSRDLRLGGYSDWRLPTIDELGALYDRLLPDRHIKGGIQLSGWWIWSATKEGSLSAWVFYFQSGIRRSLRADYSDLSRVLCVRSAK